MEKTIEWVKTSKTSGFSRMIDQTIIPYEYNKVDIKSSDEMYDAIKVMIVRGAPAIGIAGAHGVVLGGFGLCLQGFPSGCLSGMSPVTWSA